MKVKRRCNVSMQLTECEKELLLIAVEMRAKENRSVPNIADYLRALFLSDLERRGITGG